MLTDQQAEFYIRQLLADRDQLKADNKGLAASLSNLQASLTTLQNTVAALNGSPSAAGGLDIYQVAGGILHKLVTTFVSAVSFSTLTASRPVKTNGTKTLTSGLIDLANVTTDVTGVVARANGGLGNNAVAAYAGTCSTSGTGIAAPGVYAVVAGNVTVPAVGGSIAGTTSTNV